MKKIYKLLFAYFLPGVVALNMISCMPKYDDLNEWEVVDDLQSSEKDEEGVNLGDVSDEILIGELKQGLDYVIDSREHKYQYQRANSIDMYAGYGTVSKSVFEYGGALMHTYYYPNGYITGSMGESKKLYPQIYHAYYFGEAHGHPEWKAIAQILYAYSMHELVDFFGTIPYNDYRKLKEELPLEFVSGPDTYDLIFNDLKEAVETLKKVQPDAKAIEAFEGTQGGYSNLDWKNWVKFANSIRLRMALNMVKYDESKARTIAEEAVNDDIGVLQYADDDFALPDGGGTRQHPLYRISYTWNDYRLGASLENILKRYGQDKETTLIGKWFEKNNSAIKTSSGSLNLSNNKDYVGMLQGVSVDASPGASGYGAFSRFKYDLMPFTYFKVTESLLLQAEGALRKWNMRGMTAQKLYEDGIRRLFEENNLSHLYDDYISLKEAKKVKYYDYYKTEYSILDDWRGVHVGVKWDENDSKEVKLEKIITQKYIANYPMSAEAWTTFRRTGYPRLFPVPEKNAWSFDTSFDVETQIRRLPFDESTQNDRVNVPNIEKALNGRNQAGTRVWWDIILHPGGADVRDEYGQPVPKNFLDE